MIKLSLYRWRHIYKNITGYIAFLINYIYGNELIIYSHYTFRYDNDNNLYRFLQLLEEIQEVFFNITKKQAILNMAYVRNRPAIAHRKENHFLIYLHKAYTSVL